MRESKWTKQFEGLKTPFYFYDMDLLTRTLDILREESDRYGYRVHYAVKANANNKLLKLISSYGFGADCVSGNEISRAVECGFTPDTILYAGVGKRDEEINKALSLNIFSLNAESLPELEVINELAEAKGITAPVALRINPNVDARTHQYITTGIEDSKFGINLSELDRIVESLQGMNNISLKGIHFHIGSQIRRMSAFRRLCVRVNEIQSWFNSRGIYPDHLNLGGGLGINYQQPDEIPDFKQYFQLFNRFLEVRSGQTLHFEPGRSVVGQSGSLITRVLYVKNGSATPFAVVDAGMTDLIRPALYQAFHKIETLSPADTSKKYHVVGPVCETADTFGKSVDLPGIKRGDILAIRSAGAYGEVMVSSYNLRDKPGTIFSDELLD
jgi:diaminopimelate decarboxylase